MAAPPQHACKDCKEDKPAESFTWVSSKDADGVVTKYRRKQCKPCRAKALYTKTSGVLTKFNEAEKMAMTENKAHWKNDMTMSEFHKACGIKLGIQSFCRYARKGQLDQFLK